MIRHPWQITHQSHHSGGTVAVEKLGSVVDKCPRTGKDWRLAKQQWKPLLLNSIRFWKWYPWQAVTKHLGEKAKQSLSRIIPCDPGLRRCAYPSRFVSPALPEFISHILPSSCCSSVGENNPRFAQLLEAINKHVCINAWSIACPSLKDSENGHILSELGIEKLAIGFQQTLDRQSNFTRVR